MARRNNNILWLLSQSPWWWSVCFAAVAFIGFAIIGPFLANVVDNPILKGILAATQNFSWVSIIFLIPVPISIYGQAKKKKRLDQQKDIEAIRSLSWREFEELLGEAYRRQGYAVKENIIAGPDGGVDLVVEKDLNQYLVQAKQWKNRKVGVKIIREMYGIMHERHAAGVIIVTSGMFTQEAQNFASGIPVDLVEGRQLMEMIRHVQAKPAPKDTLREQSGLRECPKCGSDLVERLAKQGRYAGTKFWGCSGFPKCRHIEPFDKPTQHTVVH